MHCAPDGACAYHQTAFWRNTDSLWPHTLAVTTDNDGAHLAFALFVEGKTEEAIVHARAAAEIRPANAGAYGEVPVGLEGKALDEAILFWSARVENEPNNIGARNTFGVLLVQKHRTRAAIEQWETALALDANDGNTQSNLVWVLATAPNASLRNGIRAVELAERALKLAGGVSPILHRTLAAACAESGRFDDAIATAERGRALAEREGNRELADEFTAVLPIPTAPTLPRRQPATARRLITRSACEQELERRAARARVAQPSWLWANRHLVR